MLTLTRQRLTSGPHEPRRPRIYRCDRRHRHFMAVLLFFLSQQSICDSLINASTADSSAG